MKLLLGDTSAAEGYLAVVEKQSLLGLRRWSAPRKHSQAFFEETESLTAELNLSVRDMDAFACITGPGSFTGLRIAVSAIKMFAWASGKPAYGVQLFEAWGKGLARRYPEEGTLFALVRDARNRRVFGSVRSATGELLAPQAEAWEDFIAQLAGLAEQHACKRLILAGDQAVELWTEDTTKLFPTVESLVVEAELQIDPLAVYDLVEEQMARGVSGNPLSLEPYYLVPSQAERLNPDKNLELRPYRDTDLERLEAWEKDIFSDAWSAGAIASGAAQETSFYWIAEAGDTPVGYIFSSRVFDEAELLRIAVDRKLRGRGWGRRMLEAWLQRLRESGEVKKVLLEVRERNLAAQALYTSVGFCETGRRQGYYSDTGEAAILMDLELGKQASGF